MEDLANIVAKATATAKARQLARAKTLLAQPTPDDWVDPDGPPPPPKEEPAPDPHARRIAGLAPANVAKDPLAPRGPKADRSRLRTITPCKGLNPEKSNGRRKVWGFDVEVLAMLFRLKLPVAKRWVYGYTSGPSRVKPKIDPADLAAVCAEWASRNGWTPPPASSIKP